MRSRREARPQRQLQIVDHDEAPGAFQGRGVGAALMEASLNETKGRGADMVWLQVWKEAPWAVGFYERMGFTVVGSAKFYFGEQLGDDHVMAKSV